MLETQEGGGGGASGYSGRRGASRSKRYSGGDVSSSVPLSSFTPFCISSVGV